MARVPASGESAPGGVVGTLRFPRTIGLKSCATASPASSVASGDVAIAFDKDSRLPFSRRGPSVAAPRGIQRVQAPAQVHLPRVAAARARTAARLSPAPQSPRVRPGPQPAPAPPTRSPHATLNDDIMPTSSLRSLLRRSPLTCALALGLSAHVVAAPAPAPAPVDFDAVVVTAAGFEQKITDAPASITVITREDLAQRPYMTLLDSVRDLEGVDIGETRDKTGQGTISMRGMGADYTLILVNGRRQNNHGDIYPNNFGGNQFNHIPPLDAIERIEVIRGPMSTLYG